MGTDDDRAIADLGVLHPPAAARELLEPDRRAELRRDVAQRRLEIGVALAGGERLDVRAQPLGERAFLGGEFERAVVGAAGHADHQVDEYGRRRE